MTDRQAGRQAGTHTHELWDIGCPWLTDRQAGRQADRQADRQAGRHTHVNFEV